MGFRSAGGDIRPSYDPYTRVLCPDPVCWRIGGHSLYRLLERFRMAEAAEHGGYQRPDGVSANFPLHTVRHNGQKAGGHTRTDADAIAHYYQYGNDQVCNPAIAHGSSVDNHANAPAVSDA